MNDGQTGVCDHRWEHVSYWSNNSEFGPIANCIQCGEKLCPTWYKWRILQKEGKVP